MTWPAPRREDLILTYDEGNGQTMVYLRYPSYDGRGWRYEYYAYPPSKRKAAMKHGTIEAKYRRRQDQRIAKT